MKLYHATYKRRLRSILQKGLGNTRLKNYSDSVRGVVYFADDPDVAASYAEIAENVPDSLLDDIVILEVDSEDLDETKLFVDTNVILEDDEIPSTFEYHGIVSPLLIKIIDM